MRQARTGTIPVGKTESPAIRPIRADRHRPRLATRCPHNPLPTLLMSAIIAGRIAGSHFQSDAMHKVGDIEQFKDKYHDEYDAENLDETGACFIQPVQAIFQIE